MTSIRDIKVRCLSPPPASAVAACSRDGRHGAHPTTWLRRCQPRTAGGLRTAGGPDRTPRLSVGATTVRLPAHSDPSAGIRQRLAPARVDDQCRKLRHGPPLAAMPRRPGRSIGAVIGHGWARRPRTRVLSRRVDPRLSRASSTRVGLYQALARGWIRSRAPPSRSRSTSRS